MFFASEGVLRSPVLPSWSDLRASLFPTKTRIMAKKSLKYTPFFGQFMQAAGAVFIDRGNNAVAVRSLKEAAEDIKKRQTSLWVFAEGTRTSRPYHDVRPLKKGAFHLAVQAGLPIVPVVAENYWHIYRKGVFNPGTFKIRGVATSFPSCIPLY